MRKSVAAMLVASVLLSSRVDGAAPDAASVEETQAIVNLREVIRAVALPRLQDAPQASPEESERWMERHPVWFGLIVGAAAGAAVGAASCSKGCFPIGAGGAAIVGSWWGAGPGALIGWGIGKNRD